MTCRAQITQVARTYLNTPFHHQGRVKGRKGGIDCVGLVAGPGKELRLLTYDVQVYSRTPDGSLLVHARKCLVERSPGQRLEGTIVLFQMRASDNGPHHMGLLTPAGLIHTYANIGKVVEHSLTKAWSERIVAAFDYPGITV